MNIIEYLKLNLYHEKSQNNIVKMTNSNIILGISL